MKIFNTTICIALLAAGAVLPATAADNVAVAAQSGAVSAISGGLDEEERQSIEKNNPAYKLQLLFAAKGTPNEYLADIKVQIADSGGRTVLDTVSTGPFLQVKIPPGKYSVSADNDGVIKRQTIQVSATGAQRLVFIW